MAVHVRWLPHCQLRMHSARFGPCGEMHSTGHDVCPIIPGTGECWEYALIAADGSGRKGFLLGAGDRFAFAADRAAPLPQKPGRDLLQLANAHKPCLCTDFPAR